MNTVISVENLSKSYRLGQIGTGTLSRDLEIWLAKLRGKPNPYLKIGQSDPGELNGETLWALKDVSFQVQQGEVLGIIGRNGAGKSTLLKILSRVTAPTSGQVKVRGRIASLLEVGTGFHPELTGRENIFLNGAILGMSKQEVQRKFDEIVSFAEVEKFVDTPVKRYSSGMYVRLAFAVAAHLESEILLVDEVLAVGDAEFQKKCLGKMGDVAADEGRTVLFVSHNMGAVKSLCPGSLLLEQGNLSLKGETENIIDEYLKLDQNSGDFAQINFHSKSKSASITQISIINDKGDYDNKIVMGKPFQIEVNVKSKYKINLPVLLIQIEKKPGEIVLAAYTYDSVNNIPPLIDSCLINCSFSSSPLLPGLYYLNVLFGNFGERLDEHLRVIRIEVIGDDVYKTGRIPDPKKNGLIWVPHEWRFS